VPNPNMGRFRVGVRCAHPNLPELTAKDINDSINRLIQGGGSEPAHAIENDLRVGGKEAVGSNVTRLFQSAFGEIRIRNRHGIAVLDRLARDLAENEVIAAKVGHDERRAAFA
jgi:hypothetical protein